MINLLPNEIIVEIANNLNNLEDIKNFGLVNVNNYQLCCVIYKKILRLKFKEFIDESSMLIDKIEKRYYIEDKIQIFEKLILLYLENKNFINNERYTNTLLTKMEEFKNYFPKADFYKEQLKQI